MSPQNHLSGKLVFNNPNLNRNQSNGGPSFLPRYPMNGHKNMTETTQKQMLEDNQHQKYSIEHYHQF